jgi:hypothetical protein
MYRLLYALYQSARNKEDWESEEFYTTDNFIFLCAAIDSQQASYLAH